MFNLNRKLFRKRQISQLRDFWWISAGESARAIIDGTYEGYAYDLLDEFSDAITWLETL
jgi:hypothetical protein